MSHADEDSASVGARQTSGIGVIFLRPVLANQGGRDHYLRNSSVFAGGGTAGGRILGKTDATGSAVVDYGWSGARDVRTEDIASTIYSALGIDNTVRHDDPLGRGFEYVPEAKDGKYQPIEELW